MPEQKTEALVLSGGGAYAAYEVGVVRALAEGASAGTDHQPLDPSIITGTSAGAFNAAVLLSHSDRPLAEAARKLQAIWMGRVASQPGSLANGIYRNRADLRPWLNPLYAVSPKFDITTMARDPAFLASDFLSRLNTFAGSHESIFRRSLEFFDVSTLISTDPFRDLLRDVLRPETIRSSPRLLRIAATNWNSGESKIFGNADMSGDTAVSIVLASAAIPGFFPPVEMGGSTYVDGGVGMNTPLRPAISDGANILHVVYLDPDVSAIPLERLQNTISTFERLLLVSRSDVMDRDIDGIRRINQAIEAVRNLIARLPAAETPTVESAWRGVLWSASRNVPFREITVHRYHPREDLGGITGILNLDSDRIADLIRKGYNNAVAHRCSDEGCLIAHPAPDGAPPVMAGSGVAPTT